MRSGIPGAALLLFALLHAWAARAQAPPPADQPDLTLDAAARRAVVDTLCDRIERYYVFPDRGREVSKALRKRMSRHEYDRVESAKEFADSLTAHIHAVTPDLHLRVHYRHEPIPPRTTEEGPPPDSELRRMHEQERLLNYGFQRVERLPGNVGYIELWKFSGDPDGQATAIAGMNFLANTDALIIDLRRNGGGDPAMNATLLTYFVKPGERLLFNTFYQRAGNKTKEYWTSPYVPGPRYAGKPVYVLTSARTGSCAEEFAYDVQTHRVGTLVGAVTAGGANPGDFFRLSNHFAAFIATGRAINPVTHTNWEGVGVTPDSLTAAGVALRVAYTMAVEKLLEGARTDPERTGSLRRALEVAKNRAPDPEEDFLRRRR